MAKKKETYALPKGRVYIRTNADDFIVQIEGEYSLSNIPDLSEAILIDEGEGDRYNHAQNAYLDKPIIDDDGIYNYRYIDNEIVETTAEEKADILAHRPTTLTPLEKLESQVTYTAMMTDTLLEEE